MSYTLAQLEERYPGISWREPIAMASVTDLDDTRYACRICIANDGFLSEQIPTLPTNPDEIRQHIEKLHGHEDD